MSKEQIVTLMMVTYNRMNLTKRMLAGLFKTTKRPYNLVVVDNGSTDGTVEYLQNLNAWHGHVSLGPISMLEPSDTDLPNVQQFIFHKNEKNRGIAIGRNQCFKLADELNTDWYCTIDNDVELPEGWLQECIDILQANKKYGAIGVNMEAKPYPIVEENGIRFQSKPAGNLGTACMVFPKSLHKMLGFFNTEYGIYGEEDADFGMRARVVGYKLGYIERMGNHFGDGELDTGPYRKFKTEAHRKNLALFNRNCAAYHRKEKPVYIKYHE
jgi:GT2 family glycosyltransferase